LSPFDQTNEAHAKFSQRVKALESELATTKSTVKLLEAKAALCVTALENGAATISGLKSDLEKANADRNKTESRAAMPEIAIVRLDKGHQRC
jgi:chromosome segregation ATPase